MTVMADDIGVVLDCSRAFRRSYRRQNSKRNARTSLEVSVGRNNRRGLKRMNRAGRLIACGAVGLVTGTVGFAQGRGGGVWTTASADAQRTAAVRTDPKITRESVQKGFQFLWKRTLEQRPRGPGSLTQPVFSPPGFITYKGFKGLAYVGGSDDNVFAIDYDLNRPFWNTHLPSGTAATATAACPGGLTTVTRTTPMAPAGAARGAGGGRGRGGTDYVSTVSSGGLLHSLNPQTGTDVIPPIKLLAAGAKVV